MATATKEVDAKAILADLKASEDTMFEEYERKVKEQREKKLAGVLKPLQDRRAKAAEEMEALETEISGIDKQVAELTGTKQKGGKGKRTRMKADVIEEKCKELLGLLKGSKGLSKSDIAEKLKLEKGNVGTVIKKLKGKEIKMVGDKANAVYVLK